MRLLIITIKLIKLQVSYYCLLYPKIYNIIRFVFSLFYLFLYIKRIIFFCLIQWYFCFCTLFCFIDNKTIVFFGMDVLYITFIFTIFYLFYAITLLVLHRTIHHNIFINVLITIGLSFLFCNLVSSFMYDPITELMLCGKYITLK